MSPREFTQQVLAHTEEDLAMDESLRELREITDAIAKYEDACDAYQEATENLTRVKGSSLEDKAWERFDRAREYKRTRFDILSELGVGIDG